MNIIQVLVWSIILAILASFIHKRINKRLYQLLGQFPSYKSYPLIGNAHLFFGFTEGFLEKLEKLVQPYDRLVYWVGPMPLILLKKYDDIATVLNQCQDRDTFELVDKWIGIGLLTSRYEEWKKSRKIVAPGFTSNMLSKYNDVFNKGASNFVQNLRLVANTGEQIDVLDCVMKANLDAVVEITMGVTIQNCGKQGDDFCNALHKCMKHALRRFQFPWLLFHCIDKIYLKLTGKFKAIHQLQNIPTEVLREKQKNSHNLHQDNHDDQVNVDSSKTIVDLFIKSHLKGDDCSDTRMRDEILQIIAAQKVYEEIAQFMADNDTVSESHLANDLEYLEQCLKETMRVFSPVAVTSRRTHKEIVLKDNTIVPKNVIVISLLHFTNYDPDLYKDPEKWDPERFSKEAINQRAKTSQLFFGYGPRSCIGAKFAMMSLKVQIAHILHNYQLSTSVKVFTKQHLKMDVSIRSKIGYPIKFTSRRNGQT